MSAETLIHPKCGQSWTGIRAAHCPRCCLTLSGTSAFDAHQRLADGILTCESPEKVALVAVAKPWGTLWSWPSDGRNPWGADSDHDPADASRIPSRADVEEGVVDV